MHIKDRTFIVTGGSSGLGLATAQTLHENGAYIALLDLNKDSGEAAAQTFGQTRARFFEVDVSESASIETAVEGVSQWVQETGKPVGGVISAAGVGNPGKIIDRNNTPLDMSAIDFVLNINLRGTLDIVRQFLPLMASNEPINDGERGVVILVSSSAAFDGQMGQVAYAASKGAVASLTLPMARDLSSHGIRVVTVAPSLFESNMTKMLSAKVRKSLENAMEFPKRPGKADEFAKMVKHSIENVMLNGTVVRLDGAMRMPSRL